MVDDVEAFVNVAVLLKERGAYKIYVMATHGLLSAEAPRLIEDSPIDEVRCHATTRGQHTSAATLASNQDQCNIHTYSVT